MTPDFIQRLQNLLMTVLGSLILALVSVGSWAVYTTHSNAVSVVDVYDRMDGISHQVESLRLAGEARDKSFVTRDAQIDQLLTKHSLDISEALAEHNREIDGSVANLTGMLEQHGKDIAELKSFVQGLRDQKQVIIVRHAEADAPTRLSDASHAPAPLKAAENIISEILGVGPRHHYRSGSGRRPGQPRRTR